MSNSIWKTGNLQEADTRKQILFFAGGGRFPYYGWHCPKQGAIGSWVYDDVQKWCYIDDLIAQADKAERLQEENEAMREEFEVWHGNHKCVLEDEERLQKAVDVAVDAIKNATEYLGNQEPLVDVMAMNLYIDLSKALDKITALEQESNN